MPPTMIITIAPDRDGETMMWVSMRDADGASGPPRRVVPNARLNAFITSMQVLARGELTAVESPAHGRTEDSDPAIVGEAADGEHGR